MLGVMQRTIEPPRRVRLMAAAAGNGGPFTRPQAEAVGYTKDQIHNLARSGQWISLRRGVYVESSVLEACEADASEAAHRRHFLDAAATVLAVGNAVASHESAISIFRLNIADVPAKVSLTRPRIKSGRVRLKGVSIHRAALPPDHRAVLLGVPVTTPARTVVDLARSGSFRDGVVTADAMLHARLTTHDELRTVLAACANWPGAAQARRVIQFADAKSESALESIGRVIFAEQGLPAPECQVQITVRPGLVFRVDFRWKKFRTIAEADGLLKYSDPSALRSEKLRQEALSDLGYEIVRFTWKQLHQDPAGVADRIRHAFARALRHMGGSPCA
jgi:predicted transcriptional regulator of viral defense system